MGIRRLTDRAGAGGLKVSVHVLYKVRLLCRTVRGDHLDGCFQCLCVCDDCLGTE